MERIKIAQIFADQEQFGGKEVLVSGWARTIRDMKTFGFVELNDGSCFKNLQIVLDANALDNYREIAGQNVGAALSVTGTVVLTPEAKQPLEVKAASVAVDVYKRQYLFTDCTARQNADGTWTYEVGAEAIA